MSESGFDIETLDRSFGASQRLAQLEDRLRAADAFAVFAPSDGYTEDEVKVVHEFVNKGGRLLLVGDPSRSHLLNSLSESFGMIFRNDYLYNLIDNDRNHANIFVRDFVPHSVTEGLREIALYTAGSIRSSGLSLALTDEYTYSSTVERVEPFAAMVGTKDGNVVGLSDLTFLLSPQNAVADNDRLIANLAAHLTSGEKVTDLADFPSFFRPDVDIVLTDSELFTIASQLRGVLAPMQVSAEMSPVEDISRDTIILGMYDRAEDVSRYLGLGGVQVGDTLRTPFAAGINAAGTGILLLHKDSRRSVLVILGSTDRIVQELVIALDSGRFRDGLVSDSQGIYRFF